MSQHCLSNPSIAKYSVTLIAGVILLACSLTASAQRAAHYQYNIDMPPGAIGALQTKYNYPFRGYSQPVKIQVPPGADVSVADDGAFQFPSQSLQVGLLVGQVYRLKVANIPRHENAEVYPSLEIINRLYPPQGLKARFPVPIDIAQEDLELALEGKMVVRVIYVENPLEAFPKSEDQQHQRYFDVLPAEDPLRVADELGRPIAILRLGSRMPNYTGPDDEFMFGCPPVTLTADWTEPIVVETELTPLTPETNSTQVQESLDSQLIPPQGTAPEEAPAPNLPLDVADPADAAPSPSDEASEDNDPPPTGEDDPFIDDGLN